MWFYQLGLISLLPLFAIVAVLIKATSKGPIFFVQPRIGYNGRLFSCIKFRTMVKDALSLKNLWSTATKSAGLSSRFAMILGSRRSVTSCAGAALTNCHNSSMSWRAKWALSDPVLRFRMRYSATGLKTEDASVCGPVSRACGSQRSKQCSVWQMDGVGPHLHRSVVALAGFQNINQDDFYSGQRRGGRLIDKIAVGRHWYSLVRSFIWAFKVRLDAWWNAMLLRPPASKPLPDFFALF